MASGLVLIDYGFNTIAVGMPGARAFTSQFVGANLIIGGSALAFWALYYLLRPLTQPSRLEAVAGSGLSDVGIELITDEKDTAPKVGFYRNVEYLGYFFTFLGVVSAADLVLQVFIPVLYNEIRFWTEILLVVFGVLSYAIFFSIGRLGMQEEQLIEPIVQPHPVAMEAVVAAEESRMAEPSPPPGQTFSDILDVRLDAFTKSETGEYERRLSDSVYDLLRVERPSVRIWREERLGFRSNYLAGPYELNWDLLEDQVNRGEDLKIGSLLLPVYAIKELLALRIRPASGISS